jgi:signal transduction histidine kinase
MIEGVWQPSPERLQTCYDESVRLTKLVRDLENLARTENNVLHLNKTPLLLEGAIKKTVSGFEAELKKKNITVSISGNCPPVSADPDRIQQVMLNLLSNAVKYSNDGGSIVIKLSDDEHLAVFSIEDEGIGIPEEEVPFIFERFYRVDKSRNRLTGGSGLGLAIVRSIVEAHGGTVKAESILNKGSIFTVALPKI